MTLTERVESLEEIFADLQGTNSRLVKRDIIDSIPTELKDDFDFCLEVLAGKHKLGYKYEYVNDDEFVPDTMFQTVRDVIEYLQRPLNEHDLSKANIHKHLRRTTPWSVFLWFLCNRVYKLGIGQSVLEKSSIAPMLAKKFEGELNYGTVYVTEKLDGNRCIAYYEDDEWHFVSRNGKRMNVEFDMTGLPEELVYDGEVVAPENIELTNQIISAVVYNKSIGESVNTHFNDTSGLINRHTTNKNLVYMIFDVQDDACYDLRRQLLNRLRPKASNVRILPELAVITTNRLGENESLLADILDKVVTIGGEGIMLNWGGCPYEHKRTGALLKYKQVQTMDMKVKDITPGTGKYFGLVGALLCEAEHMGMRYSCSVGSGLSDDQRLDWALNPERIIGKVVEVSYFSLSQNKDTSGTGNFSLRFPRLKGLRADKNDTSIY